jgi:hypothetical protein
VASGICSAIIDSAVPVGLEAAAAPAPAQRALVVEREVADLPGGAGAAPEQRVVDDQPGTDAGGDLHEDHVRMTLAGAVPVLGERPEVGVVVDLHVAAEVLG